MGHERRPFTAGLRHEHPVEGITMNQREPPGCYSVLEIDRNYPRLQSLVHLFRRCVSHVPVIGLAVCSRRVRVT